MRRAARFSLCSVFLLLTFFSAPTKAEEALRVGILLPLTGALADYGAAVRNGIHLAQKENPERFKDIQFVYEDHAYDNAKVLTSYRKVVEIDKVALVYVFGTEPGLILAPIAESKKFPLVAVASDPRASIGRKYVVQFCNRDEDFGRIQAQELERRGAKRVGVLKTEISYFNTLLRGMQKNFSSPIDVIQEFQPSDQDFKTPITRLKREKYDYIGVFLMPGQMTQFFRQASALGFRSNFFGSDGFDNSEDVLRCGELMNGSFFANANVTEDFRKRYVDEFKNDVQIVYAGNAFDFASVLTSAVEINRADVLAAMVSMKNYSGALGQMTYASAPETGNFFSFPVVLKEIHDGKIVIAKPR